MQTMKRPLAQHQDQRYLVLGIGLTGYAVACYLLARGYRCWVQDDRDMPPYQAQLLERFADVEIYHVRLYEPARVCQITLCKVGQLHLDSL